MLFCLKNHYFLGYAYTFLNFKINAITNNFCVFIGVYYINLSISYTHMNEIIGTQHFQLLIHVFILYVDIVHKDDEDEDFITKEFVQIYIG